MGRKMEFWPSTGMMNSSFCFQPGWIERLMCGIHTLREKFSSFPGIFIVWSE